MIGSMAVKDEPAKGSYDQTVKRLVMLRSLLPAESNERNGNYLRRSELIPHK